jgi:hypothetical protein
MVLPVAEHCCGRHRTPRRTAQLRQDGARIDALHCVPGVEHDLGPLGREQLERLLRRPATRRKVQVGHLRDPQTMKRGRQARHQHVVPGELYASGLDEDRVRRKCSSRCRTGGGEELAAPHG